MNEYLNLMQNFDPDNIEATGAVMQEKSVKVVDSLPQQTAISDDQTLEHEAFVPKYMAPQKIEVKRYVLRK